MPKETIIIIAITILLVTILLFGLLFLMTRKKQKPTIDIEWLINALGKDNITNVGLTNKRIRITVLKLENVNLELLKQETRGIFVRGNEIVMTFLDNTEEIYQSLKTLIK
ncbi:MAG: hypothetical protein RBS76_03025 [Acholeplasmatales bacterium]|jgi:phosphotransferase system IIB component|nr:hypothetical protein [Acholeplasmataceae bacterium]MDY0115456.1 hypothetical protein [Acholeplasmatales bacterium]MCK9234012.1 hypothetical protein [Acholeplasmataceae bacterium]MCK9289608.1 hypothetical protein [Acholeplasmataceae bacterium]MCK9427638.1 hypothetical protein [Acholeplasmataceae bacterium]